MATLGYGDVIPSDALTRTLACVQVVIGVGWVTVVLSAAAALARPKVNQMLEEVWQEEGETAEDPPKSGPRLPAAPLNDGPDGSSRDAHIDPDIVKRIFERCYQPTAESSGTFAVTRCCFAFSCSSSVRGTLLPVSRLA